MKGIQLLGPLSPDEMRSNPRVNQAWKEHKVCHGHEVLELLVDAYATRVKSHPLVTALQTAGIWEGSALLHYERGVQFDVTLNVYEVPPTCFGTQTLEMLKENEFLRALCGTRGVAALEKLVPHFALTDSPLYVYAPSPRETKPTPIFLDTTPQNATLFIDALHSANHRAYLAVKRT